MILLIYWKNSRSNTFLVSCCKIIYRRGDIRIGLNWWTFVTPVKTTNNSGVFQVHWLTQERKTANLSNGKLPLTIKTWKEAFHRNLFNEKEITRLTNISWKEEMQCFLIKDVSSGLTISELCSIAEDMMIRSERKDDLQNNLNYLSECCEKSGLEVNTAKNIVVFRKRGRVTNFGNIMETH